MLHQRALLEAAVNGLENVCLLRLPCYIYIFRNKLVRELGVSDDPNPFRVGIQSWAMESVDAVTERQAPWKPAGVGTGMRWSGLTIQIQPETNATNVIVDYNRLGTIVPSLTEKEIEPTGWKHNQ